MAMYSSMAVKYDIVMKTSDVESTFINGPAKIIDMVLYPRTYFRMYILTSSELPNLVVYPAVHILCKYRPFI